MGAWSMTIAKTSASLYRKVGCSSSLYPLFTDSGLLILFGCNITHLYHCLLYSMFLFLSFLCFLRQGTSYHFVQALRTSLAVMALDGNSGVFGFNYIIININ
jgi:hypothetical protein